MRTPKKAVISAAGFGTRFFPVTKAINKSLLPVLNRPVIDYLITELITANVAEIAFVILPGDDQLKRYVYEEPWIQDYFTRRGWQDKYTPVRELQDRLRATRFHWIEQPVDGRYGTAIPPILARDWIGDSEWFLLSGDDIVIRSDGGSDLSDLAKAHFHAGTQAAMQVTEVPWDRVSRYGIVRTHQVNGVPLLAGAVEKPRTENAPTNLASISRFLLAPDFFDTLAAVAPDPATGEYLSISALVTYARTHSVLVHTLKGTYYDCGHPRGWLEANIAAARLEGIDLHF